jgi:hypothetical protein
MSSQENAIEAQILQRQLETPDVRASSLEVFRYYTALDRVIIGISALCALLAGSSRILPSVRINSSPFH